MAENLDLLGDPIPENWGGRGRPPHLPTRENRNKVIVLLALEWEERKIAQALGITRPTLRKHYFRELKVRDEARARLEAELIVNMTGKALTGDVPAYREVRKVLEKADLRHQHQAMVGQTPGEARAATREPAIGKKEQRQLAAEQVDGIFAPPAPPSRLLSH